MKLIYLRLLIFLFCSFLGPHALANDKVNYTIFGPVSLEDPVIKDLINDSSFQRLKYIDQSGTLHYLGFAPSYTRYEHSIGVYALLKKYNAPFIEQVAGLLHDISHTVFSHVTDSLFKSSSDPISYQDDIHEWYLKETNVEKTLKKYSISISDISTKRNKFPALEQELPILCADRIEYNLHTGLILKFISLKEISEIMKDLQFKNGKWYFTNIKSARKLGMLSLKLTENFFGAAWNFMIYKWSADILKRALELKLLTLHQIHFDKDKEIFDILSKSEDAQIKDLMIKCKTPQRFFKIITNGPYNLLIQPKFRGIDPAILIDSAFKKLTEIDSNYRKEFYKVKNLLLNGIKVKFIE